MEKVYNLQDLMSMGLKLKFSTKIELFRNRKDYEKEIVDENAAITCTNNLVTGIYIKVNEVINAINSAKVSDSYKNDILNQISKVPSRELDVSNCNIITTVSELEKAFKSNIKGKNIVNVNVDLDDS
jgi:uncharacterized protein YeeX (DUF496 family)